jgi:hypothetical protein
VLDKDGRERPPRLEKVPLPRPRRLLVCRENEVLHEHMRHVEPGGGAVHLDYGSGLRVDDPPMSTPVRGSGCDRQRNVVKPQAGGLGYEEERVVSIVATRYGEDTLPIPEIQACAFGSCAWFTCTLQFEQVRTFDGIFEPSPP